MIKNNIVLRIPSLHDFWSFFVHHILSVFKKLIFASFRIELQLIWNILSRPHDYKSCFKAGFVLNGAIQWSSILEGKCPGNQIKVGKWLKLEVTVSDVDAMISLNGRHLISYKLHYPAHGRGGELKLICWSINLKKTCYGH